MALPTVALPGTLLGPASKYAPGPGTHIWESQVYSSVAGAVVSTPAPTTQPASTLPLLSISHPTSTSTTTGTPRSTLLPEINAPVLACITRLGARSATAEILVISSTSVCSTPFQAQIRREDIRATEKDKVTVQESFRVGDLVKAVVISLGDQSNYYLSTARNELGVVVARGENGEALVPVSWREVRDLRSGRGESRKVAKPF